MKKTLYCLIFLSAFSSIHAAKIYHGLFTKYACTDFQDGDEFLDGNTIDGGVNYSEGLYGNSTFCAPPGETITFDFNAYSVDADFFLDLNVCFEISGSQSADGLYGCGGGPYPPNVITSTVGGCLTFNTYLLPVVLNPNGGFDIWNNWRASISISDCSCPILTTPPSALSITSESSCTSSCTSSGGALSLEPSPCPAGSTLHSFADDTAITDGEVLSAAPSYNQSASETYYVGCVCNIDGSLITPIQSITTTPEICVVPDIPTLAVIDNDCQLCGNVFASGAGGTLTYYSGMDATEAMTNAIAEIDGSTQVPDYLAFPDILYVCVTETDLINGCVSDPVCGQTEPVICISLEDPCTCLNNASAAGDDGHFGELVTILGQTGLTFYVDASSTGIIDNASADPPVSPTSIVGGPTITFTETPINVLESEYSFGPFRHIDEIGYNMVVMQNVGNDGDTTNDVEIGMIGNKCGYPNPTILNTIPDLCTSDEPIILQYANSNGGPVNGTSFDLDLNNDDNDNPDNTGLTVLDPSGLADGIHALIMNYQGGNDGNHGESPDGGITLVFPGCIQPIVQTFSLYENPDIVAVVTEADVCDGTTATGITLESTTNVVSPDFTHFIVTDVIEETNVTGAYNVSDALGTALAPVDVLAPTLTDPSTCGRVVYEITAVEIPFADCVGESTIVTIEVSPQASISTSTPNFAFCANETIDFDLLINAVAGICTDDNLRIQLRGSGGGSTDVSSLTGVITSNYLDGTSSNFNFATSGEDEVISDILTIGDPSAIVAPITIDYVFRSRVRPNNSGNCSWSPNVTVSVTINPVPVVNPTELSQCENPIGSGIALFTLEDAADATATSNTGAVSVDAAGSNTVSYHICAADAWSNMNVLTSPHLGSNGQILFARVDDGTCAEVAEITLLTSPLPEANELEITVCEDSLAGSNFGTIDLTTLEPAVSLTGDIFEWYDADPAIGTLYPDASAAEVVKGGEVWTVVTIATTGCSVTVQHDVTINSMPMETVAPIDAAVCNGQDAKFSVVATDENGNPVFFQWRVSTDGGSNYTDIDGAANPSALTPNLTVVDGDAEYVDANMFQVRLTDCNGCERLTPGGLLTLVDAPLANATSLSVCENPFGSQKGEFTLTDADADVNAGAADVTVTYHTCLADAETNSNALTSPYLGLHGQIVYARAEDTSGTIPTCWATAEVTLETYDMPNIDEVDVKCIGSGIADVTVSATNAATTNGYNLTDGAGYDVSQHTGAFAGVTPNATYTLTVTTDDGCTTTESVTVDCNCELAIANVCVNDCDPASNQYSLTILLTHDDAPTGEDIEVSVGGVVLATVTPNVSGVTTVNLADASLLSDGTTGMALDVNFDTSVACADAATYDVPEPCNLGSIGDFVFDDLNNNGVHDAGEPGLEGVTVELDNGTCVLGSDCPTTITDAGGFYSFDDLVPGDYTVIVDQASASLTGFTITTVASHAITLTPNEANVDADFGFINSSCDANQGTVTGP